MKIAIVALLSVGAISTHASLYTFTNDVNGQQGEVRSTTPLGGAYSEVGSVMNFSNLRVGEYKDLENAWLARDVIKFGYSTAALGVGETVTSATLRLYVDFSQLNASGAGSSVLLSYSQTDSANNNNENGDFEDASFTLIGTMAGLDSSTTAGAWYEFDVTVAVLDDLANDGTGITAGSSFKMQLNDDLQLDSSDTLDYITFRDYSDASGVNAPELILETIPEPATIGMLGLGALMTLMIRRMRIAA
jgi:hypothetical protein